MDDRKRRLEFACRQFETSKLQAMRFYAEATTGVSCLNKTQYGREPTEEEKAKGITIGWQDHTDQEKVQRALETMGRHIHFMNELNETINELMSSLEE